MSFFKNVASGLTGPSRDTILKAKLIKNLSECVKDIQYTNQFEENFQSILGPTDSSNCLCMALEAICLHGLKDTLLRKAKIAISGDSDQRPEPNFWPLILILSHRQSIDHISSLTQIKTEIGQCRAWIRLALNECLLSSYMVTLLKNISAIKSFYKRSAFVCDAELLDQAEKLIEGLECCTQFNLPLNSSLLNQWPEQVLELAGVWTPITKTEPITSGFDVASTINDEKSDSELGINLPPVGNLALSEDDALKFILRNESHPVPETPDSDECNLILDKQFLQETPSSATKVQNIIRKESLQEHICSTPISSSPFCDSSFVIPNEPIHTGNSLLVKSGWSSEKNEDMNASITSDSSHGSSLIKTPDNKSLSSFIDPASTLEENINKPNLKQIMEGIHKELRLNTDDGNDVPNVPIVPATPDDPMVQGMGFEVLSDAVSSAFTIQELQHLISLLGTLSREKGLDFQNYQCNGCQDLLGSTVSRAKVCSYSGEYYCANCMDSNVFIIPARVIHNWDFKRYPVSKKVALFLIECQHHPWVDMKKFNPKIYAGVSYMGQLKELRIQLNFLRAYIFTCRDDVIKELQKRVWPREYFYDHVHQYAISDLAQIPNGSLALQLEKVVSWAKTHVYECWLCSQKAYICEVCKDPKVLYPFETEITYRCDECSSVFHAKCQNAKQPCPKCVRKQNRNDSSLSQAVHNQFIK